LLYGKYIAAVFNDMENDKVGRFLGHSV